MLTKYAVKGRWKEARIEEVEVLRETEKCVYLPSNRRGVEEVREAKTSEWREYYDTWEEAHAVLVLDAETRLSNARRALEIAQGHAGNVRGMRRRAAVGAA